MRVGKRISISRAEKSKRKILNIAKKTGIATLLVVAAFLTIRAVGINIANADDSNSIVSVSPSEGSHLGGNTVDLTLSSSLASPSFTAIDAGNFFSSCGLGKDGKAYCWGDNGWGQLGNGAVTSSPTPVAVSQGEIPNGVTLTSISNGDNSACVIGSNNKVYCWGGNDYGQLGNGTTTNSSTPVNVSQGEIPDGVTIKAIDSGGNDDFYGDFTCAIGSNNEAYCWGSGTYGQLGNGTTTNSSTPVAVSQGEIPDGVTIKSISVGGNSACVLGSDSKAYCWGGYPWDGEPGNGTVGSNSTPVAVSQGEIPDGVTLTSISTGNKYVCALGSNDEAYCWGSGFDGDHTTPVAVSQGEIPDGVTLTSISTGNAVACVIGSNNKAYCWGGNNAGQLGNNTTDNSSTPVAVKNTATVKFGGITGDVISYSDDGKTISVIAPMSRLLSGVVSIVISSIQNSDIETSYSYTNSSLSVSSLSPMAGYTSGGTSVIINGSGFGQTSSLSANSISAGGLNTCAIKSDNKAYCWGANLSGQLGNGATTGSSTPVAVSQGEIPDGVTLTSIAAGDSHACAVGSDDKAYCWGANLSGQLGNGATTGSSTPVAVSQGEIPDGVTIKSISTGAEHTCAVGSDDKAYCWGTNYEGGFGNDTTTSSLAPVSMYMPDWMNSVSYLSVGDGHTCLISDNNVYCSGSNNRGQLGSGNLINFTTLHNVVSQSTSTPKVYFDDQLATSVTFNSSSELTVATPAHSVGIVSVKVVNPDGESVTKNNAFTYVDPTQASAPTNLTATTGLNDANLSWNAPSDSTSNPVTDYKIQYSSDSGKTWTTVNDGVSTNTSVSVNKLISSTEYIFKVSAITAYGTGKSATVEAITQKTATDPDLTAINPVGGSFDGGNTVDLSGINFTTPGASSSIASGYYHTCALDTDGKAYCWGTDGSGQLGNGAVAEYSSTPVAVLQGEVPDGVTFTDISSGSDFTCVLGSDGKAYCWGYGTDGELGNGLNDNSSTPVAVLQGEIPDGVTLTSIAAGNSHVCAIGSDRKAYCWGYGGDYELGNGTADNSSTPVAVSQGAIPDGVTLTSIAAGDSHTCALGSDDKTYCWGGNSYGELGNGTNESASTPVAVSQGEIPDDVTISAISAEYDYTCALGSDGEAYCWGYNGNGQLGNNTTDNSSTPVSVSQGEIPDGTTLTSVSAGEDHTCAIGSDDKAYCWGNGTAGELGNDATESSSVPVQVGIQFHHSDSTTPPTVLFGDVPSPSVTLVSPTEIEAVAPEHAPGAVVIKVITADNKVAVYGQYIYQDDTLSPLMPMNPISSIEKASPTPSFVSGSGSVLRAVSSSDASNDVASDTASESGSQNTSGGSSDISSDASDNNEKASSGLVLFIIGLLALIFIVLLGWIINKVKKSNK